MKITFIIYGVSWLILLAIYPYMRKENTFNWNDADGVEKFALIFFAPIVVLFIPFMLFSQVRDNKKLQKATEMYARYSSTPSQQIISLGNKYHDQVYSYLKQKVESKDFNF